jgi:transposase
MEVEGAMRQPEALFHQLLGLGENWAIAGLRVRAEDGTVEIAVQETPQLWYGVSCEADGGALRPYDHGRERRWRHLNIFQYRCEIVCALPRGKCGKCGSVKTVAAPWEGLGKGFTMAFEAMCLLLLRDMPVARVAEFVGEHDTRLWRMLTKHVDKAMAEKDMSEVTAVCCDELAIRKGHVYATVFADAKQRDVLFATQGKDAATWQRFAQDLRAHGGDPMAVTQAAMDMSKSYQAGAREHCPNAQQVFDKFHVIKLANDAVDKVRREEMWLTPDIAEMKRSRFIWLKNPNNLTERQIASFQQLSKMNLQTAKAYQMRLNLQAIYAGVASQARWRLLRWIVWVRKVAAHNTLLAPMAKLAKTIRKHFAGILAYWDHRLTNAFMEGLMSVFSATKRKARGYRSFAYLRTMLYFTASNLNLPMQPLGFHSK